MSPMLMALIAWVAGQFERYQCSCHEIRAVRIQAFKPSMLQNLQTAGPDFNLELRLVSRILHSSHMRSLSSCSSVTGSNVALCCCTHAGRSVQERRSIPQHRTATKRMSSEP
jgi:hypothetical protein